jgi:hypothetical protein
MLKTFYLLKCKIVFLFRYIYMKGHFPNASPISYAQGLAQFGFNYHNIIRPQYRINNKRLDWYMTNLVKDSNVDVAFACIEPDICKITNKPYGTNHIHFAYKGPLMSREYLSKRIRCKKYYLLDTWSIPNNLDYFTKHLGKSLSYHNIYV